MDKYLTYNSQSGKKRQQLEETISAIRQESDEYIATLPTMSATEIFVLAGCLNIKEEEVYSHLLNQEVVRVERRIDAAVQCL